MYWLRFFARALIFALVLLVGIGYLYLFSNPQLMPSWMVHVSDSGRMRFQWWAHFLMGAIGFVFYFLLRRVGDPGAGELYHWSVIYPSARRLTAENSKWAHEVLVKLDRAHEFGYMRRRPRRFRKMREEVSGFDDYGAEIIEKIRLMRRSDSHRVRFVHRDLSRRITAIGDYERWVDRYLRRHEARQAD